MKKPVRYIISTLLMVALIAPSTATAQDGDDYGVTQGLGSSVREASTWELESDRPGPYQPFMGSISGDQLGMSEPSVSPGLTIGHTWYDRQHNGSQGRMIVYGFDPISLAFYLNFTWTHLPGPVFQSRGGQYTFYNFASGYMESPVNIVASDDFMGYVDIDVTNDGRAVIGGHNVASGESNADPQFWWDFGPAFGFFAQTDEVPQALQDFTGGIPNSGSEVIWPKFRYVEGAIDTVLHVLAVESVVDPASPRALYYFHRAGSDVNPSATWTYPPRIIDTVYNVAHDLTADDNGRVGICWMANLPCPGDPDTASGCECRLLPTVDNDLYCQLSHDFGVTWEPRVNITNYRATEGLTDGYRCTQDCSVQLDASGFLHVAWSARRWYKSCDYEHCPEFTLFRGRIFHWSENMPYIRSAHDFDWDQTTCNGGTSNLNVAQLSLSECNDRLYLLFTQFNDIPGGVEDDCANESNPGYPYGAANGDLWVTVSNDGGLTWDRARNATSTYSPDCDSSSGFGGPCASEHWSSMTSRGTDVGLHPSSSEPEVVVLNGGLDNGWYLDVQYIADPSAGAIVLGEGTWQNAEVKWFRLACVAAITAPAPIFSPHNISYPAWVKPGQTLNMTITIENLGNAAYNYTAPPTDVELTGNPGWLSTSGFSGFVNFGVSNTATGTIVANASSYSPGTVAQLTGLVIFTGNPAGPDTIPVSVIVADTIVPPVPDTVATACLSLAVLNNGEFGDQGTGKVNMDFYDAGDCDTNATVYLYDGSPVIGWISGADTVGNWSVFGNSYLTPVGFYQQSEGSKSVVGVNDVYTSKFSTRDTSLLIEKTYYAPQGGAADCRYIIQRLRVWSAGGVPHSHIAVGEAIDWNIPSDSSARNGSGYNESAALIYQYGGEYHQDDTGANPACQDSDVRYGGMKFLGQFKKTATWTDLGAVSGAYTADNPTYVYGNDNGFLPGELYAKMQETGFSTYSTANPDSTFTDLHMVMTFKTNYSVAVGETLVVYTALLTEEDGGLTALNTTANDAYDWYCANVLPDPPGCGCCQVRGDVDGSGTINVSDLTYLVARLFQGGPPPPCVDEGDVDGSGSINVSDLTYLVARLFQGGPPPPPC